MVTAEKKRKKKRNVTPLAQRRNSLPWWAEHTGISERTLWRHVSTGKLRTRKIGGRTIVLPADMDAFVASEPDAPPKQVKATDQGDETTGGVA